MLGGPLAEGAAPPQLQSPREGGSAYRGGLVVDASAEVGEVEAALLEEGRRPESSRRRRWKGGTKDQSLPTGSPNETITPGVVNVHLSSELQTAQRASTPATHQSVLGDALTSVLACVGLMTGSRASMAHGHVLPLVLMMVGGIAICGALMLYHNRRSRGALYPRGVQHPSQGSSKFNTPAPTIQSLGGSSVPSFGSRPNTALSVGSVGSRDLSPEEKDSILGPTRPIVRFSSAEVLASRQTSRGSDHLPAMASPASGAEVGPLKPLCRALVLPSHEAHLQVQLSSLVEAARSGGEFHILGPMGNRLLRAEVRSVDAGRMLEIFMASASDTLARNARVAVVTTSGRPEASGLLISGPDARPYAELASRRGGFAVLCPGRPRPVLVLSGEAGGLQFAASSGDDGQHLAASSLGRAPGGSERLEVRVKAGVDTALVLSCILAAVLFG